MSIDEPARRILVKQTSTWECESPSFICPAEFCSLPVLCRGKTSKCMYACIKRACLLPCPRHPDGIHPFHVTFSLVIRSSCPLLIRHRCVQCPTANWGRLWSTSTWSSPRRWTSNLCARPLSLNLTGFPLLLSWLCFRFPHLETFSCEYSQPRNFSGGGNSKTANDSG